MAAVEAVAGEVAEAMDSGGSMVMGEQDLCTEAKGLLHCLTTMKLLYRRRRREFSPKVVAETRSSAMRTFTSAD